MRPSGRLSRVASRVGVPTTFQAAPDSSKSTLALGRRESSKRTNPVIEERKLKMKFNLYGIGAFFVLCFSAAAATPQGDYILIDQGRFANQQAYSLLGHLTLDGAGNVQGAEVFRSRGILVNATVTGTYTMSAANSGTMSLSALQSDAEEPQTLIHNYRFVVDASKRMQAVRTDAGVLATPSFSPATLLPSKGTFTIKDLNDDAALLGELALDGNGALSGKAWLFSPFPSVTANASVTGSYAADKTSRLGRLTLSLRYRNNEDGEWDQFEYHYATVAADGRVMAIRLDPSAVSVASLEPQ